MALRCRAAPARGGVAPHSGPSAGTGMWCPGRREMLSHKPGGKSGLVRELRGLRWPEALVGWEGRSGSASLWSGKACHSGSVPCSSAEGPTGGGGTGRERERPAASARSGVWRFLGSRRCETGLVSQPGEQELFPTGRCDSTLARSGFDFRLGRSRMIKLK